MTSRTHECGDATISSALESRLKRYLHIGTEKNALYLCNRKFTIDKFNSFNMDVPVIMQLLSSSTSESLIVPAIIKAATDGYIVQPYFIYYALGLCVRRSTNQAVVCAAYKAARKLSSESSSYLLAFTHFLREIAKTSNKKGFGAGWRRTIYHWYKQKPTMELAQIILSNPRLLAWNHKYIQKICHLKALEDPGKNALLMYIRVGYETTYPKFSGEPRAREVLEYLRNVEAMRKATSPESICRLINSHKFTVEFCPDWSLRNTEVWKALISVMDIETVICNLNRMAISGLLNDLEFAAFLSTAMRNAELSDTSLFPTKIFVIGKQYEGAAVLKRRFLGIQRTEQRRQNEGNNQPNAPPLNPDFAFRTPVVNMNVFASLQLLYEKSLLMLAPSGLRYLVIVDTGEQMRTRRTLGNRYCLSLDAATVLALSIIRSESDSNVKVMSVIKGNVSLPIITSKNEESMNTLSGKLLACDGESNILVSKIIRTISSGNEKFDIILLLCGTNIQTKQLAQSLEEYRKEISTNAKLVTCMLPGKPNKIRRFLKKNMFLICGFNEHIGRLICAYSRGAFT